MTAPHGQLGKESEKRKTHPLRRVTIYRLESEVRLSSHWQTHNLITIPVRRAASGWNPAMYNQRKRPVRNGDGVPAIVFTQPRTCNPVPSSQSQKPLPPQGQNSNCGGNQESWKNFPFIAHVGSLNREGVACTRKATTEKKGYTVDKFCACAASVLLQLLTIAVVLSVASNSATDKSCEMDAERQRSTRTSRATVKGTCPLWWQF